ncbi:hypothetical protein BZG36_02674 [Bifiguratus adelaidae]|uniref:Pseudouridine synthase I TruA alpha/beta domain-containing protein n=1 Tax=Bifiguratus adelaidae TaxID=1938954 RepID=A0A261Y1J9_9FUNG|nr:hypothetical protein BZG36_02674 [Bifiguratus adelaidae]
MGAGQSREPGQDTVIFFNNDVPLRFSQNLVDQLETRKPRAAPSYPTDSDSTSTSHPDFERQVQERVQEELRRIRERESQLKGKVEQELARDDGSSSANAVVTENDIEQMVKRIKRANPKEVSPEVTKAQQTVMECYRSKKIHPLDCWAEVEHFKKTTKASSSIADAGVTVGSASTDKETNDSTPPTAEGPKPKRAKTQKERREYFKEHRSFAGRDNRRQLGSNTQEDDGEKKSERLGPKKKAAVLFGYCGAGYSGLQINPGAKTIEGELFDAFVKIGAVSKDNSDDPRKRVVQSFHAKTMCDSRKYEYFLPTYVFLPPTSVEPEDEGSAETHVLISTTERGKFKYVRKPTREEMAEKRAYRIDEPTLTKVRDIIAQYEGTHNFYNFTVKASFQEKTNTRYIKSFKALDPIVIDGTEWLRINIHGQSFMLHQIRKMIGLLVLMVRASTPVSLVPKTYGPKAVNIPKAPGLGLLLDQPLFSTYNKKVQKDGKEPIDFDKYADVMTKFKHEQIYTRIFEEEFKEDRFDCWLKNTDGRQMPELGYLHANGEIPDDCDLTKKERVLDDEDLVDGDNEETIEVPLPDDQILEVHSDELPANPAELIDIFQNESCPLKYWRLLALEYQRQNKIDDAMFILSTALTAGPSSSTPRQKLPLLVLQAALHISIAKRAKEPAEKEKHLKTATQLINESDRINPQYDQAVLVKGLLYLQRRNLDDALRSFHMILDNRPYCTPALIGRARIHYHRKQYKQALRNYQNALIAGEETIDVRLGIGLCFWRLNMVAEAKYAFCRAAELDPSSATALIYIAILELNEGKDTAKGDREQFLSLQHAAQHMQAAFKADPKNPIVLNMLANYYFMRRDFAKTMQSASRALKLASTNSIKAEAAYQIARANHQMEKFDDAYSFYKQAVSFQPHHLLALYGLGQMQIRRRATDAAIQSFETILKSEKDSKSVKMVLGSLYTRKGEKQKALNLLKDLVQGDQNATAVEDADTWLELAQLWEDMDEDKALQAYNRALELLAARGVAPRLEVLNNAAALEQTHDALDIAHEYYERARSEFEKALSADVAEGERREPMQQLQLTIDYNYARLLETRNDLDKAAEIYRNIIAKHPSYPDAHLRLGAIEISHGHNGDAVEHFKEVFDTCAQNTDAWILIGITQASQNEIRDSRKSLEKVLKDCDRNDIYALVALGNHHLNVARDLKRDDQKQQRDQSYRLAVEFYDKVLRKDPNNVFAANGIAIAIAQKGMLQEAKDYFSQIREAAGKVPAVSVNLAHIYTELGQYRHAIVLYENVSKRFYEGKDANLLIYIARAYYTLARVEKSVELMQAALKQLEKALHLMPNDRSILFNIALAHSYCAQFVHDKDSADRTLSMLAQAGEGVDLARTIFKSLTNVDKDEYVPYDRKIAEQRVRFTESLKAQVLRDLKSQGQFEEERAKKLEETRIKRETEKARKEQERLAEMEAKAEELRKIEEQRREVMEKIREENALMAAREEYDSDEGKKTKKRKRRIAEEDLVDSEDDASDGSQPVNGDVNME